MRKWGEHCEPWGDSSVITKACQTSILDAQRSLALIGEAWVVDLQSDHKGCPEMSVRSCQPAGKIRVDLWMPSASRPQEKPRNSSWGCKAFFERKHTASARKVEALTQHNVSGTSAPPNPRPRDDLFFRRGGCPKSLKILKCLNIRILAFQNRLHPCGASQIQDTYFRRHKP